MHVCIYASMHLCIHASMCIYASMGDSMHLFIYASIYPAICLSVACIKAARSSAEDSSIYVCTHIWNKTTIVRYVADKICWYVSSGFVVLLCCCDLNCVASCWGVSLRFGMLCVVVCGVAWFCVVSFVRGSKRRSAWAIGPAHSSGIGGLSSSQA